MRSPDQFPDCRRSPAPFCRSVRDSRDLLSRVRGLESWKCWNRLPVEAREPLGRADDALPEGFEVESVEPLSQEPSAAFVEERTGAGEVAVGQMLVADRDLDQALERLALAAVRVAPRRLE